MNETKLTKEALYVPSIVFESGTLSSSSEGKVTWNGEELGGSTLDASGDITFTGLDTFTQYVTFNGGMISNGDIVLNGSKLLLANGAAVEIYQGTDIPLPEGGGTGSTTPGTGNSGESIDTSNFAKLNEDNTFTGNNNFTGNLTLDGKNILTEEDISSLPGKHNVGEQWISMDGTIPDGGLAFLGQTVSKTTYYELYNWVETHNRFKTEAEWQSLYTANNGNVSFYAKVDDNTFRLPSFKGYLKANTTAGGYTKEGLPNITGSARGYYWDDIDQRHQGAILQWTDSNKALNSGATDGYRHGTIHFDASRSSSIYGNSSHVTPETNTILIGVYAIVSVKNTSGYDLQEIINIANSTKSSFDESLDTINNQINNISNNFGFIGEIKFSSYDNVPYGYLICDGSKISRTTYSALFNVIGTKWGTGDGSTTFTLPNLIGKVAWGDTSAGTYKSAGLPSLPYHHHTFNRPQGDVMYGNGTGNSWWGSTRGYTETTTDASWGTSSFYGKSTTVQPPAATVVPVIKYI